MNGKWKYPSLPIDLCVLFNPWRSCQVFEYKWRCFNLLENFFTIWHCFVHKQRVLAKHTWPPSKDNIGRQTKLIRRAEFVAIVFMPSQNRNFFKITPIMSFILRELIGDLNKTNTDIYCSNEFLRLVECTESNEKEDKILNDLNIFEICVYDTYMMMKI